MWPIAGIILLTIIAAWAKSFEQAWPHSRFARLLAISHPFGDHQARVPDRGIGRPRGWPGPAAHSRRREKRSTTASSSVAVAAAAPYAGTPPAASAVSRSPRRRSSTSTSDVSCSWTISSSRRSGLHRAFHAATYHPANPVLKPEREWETRDPYALRHGTSEPYGDGVQRRRFLRRERRAVQDVVHGAATSSTRRWRLA